MEKNKLDAAVFRVMEKVKYLKKDGKNVQQGYSFASAESIIGEIREAALSEKLRIAVNYTDITDLEPATTKAGGVLFRVRLRCEVTLRHEGEQETHVFYGEGSDSGDKAQAKAATMALKQILRQLFLLETGDHDADRETPPESVKKIPADALAAIPETLKAAMRVKKMTRPQVENLYRECQGDLDAMADKVAAL